MEGQNTINDADDDDVPLLLVPQINASVPAGIAHQDLSDDDDEDGSHEQHHLHYIPLHSKPTPRQEWVQHTCQHTGKKLQISSLASSKEHRIATDSDLVLDLVYVIILAHLGRIFRGRAIEHNDPTWVITTPTLPSHHHTLYILPWHCADYLMPLCRIILLAIRVVCSRRFVTSSRCSVPCGTNGTLR